MRTLLSVVALALLASTAWGEMYTWKDRHGTVFYTNSIHEIPTRYLKKARVLDVATGKKGGLVTQQPASPAGTAVQGQTQGPANVATAPLPLTSPPSPTSPLAAATADSAAASAPQQQPSPAPASVAAPPAQTRVIFPRRHRQPRGED